MSQIPSKAYEKFLESVDVKMAYDNNNDSFEDQLKLHKDRAAHYFSAYEAAQAKIAKLELDNNMYIAHYGDLERKYNKTLEVGKQRYEQTTKLQEAVKVLQDGHKAIISAKKSGCVEYKGCECWHQNASLALSKADAILGQGEK